MQTGHRAAGLLITATQPAWQTDGRCLPAAKLEDKVQCSQSVLCSTPSLPLTGLALLLTRLMGCHCLASATTGLYYIPKASKRINNRAEARLTALHGCSCHRRSARVSGAGDRGICGDFRTAPVPALCYKWNRGSTTQREPQESPKAFLGRPLSLPGQQANYQTHAYTRA